MATTTTSPLGQLISRLAERGVLPDHIQGLIREVSRITSESRLATKHMVNFQLQQLGWGAETLDETSFQLIVYILESELRIGLSTTRPTRWGREHTNTLNELAFGENLAPKLTLGSDGTGSEM